jgi:glycosyltransferase involved in cell wall biosynthesis
VTHWALNNVGAWTPNVSVIVPFRNSERWLPDTLESLHRDLETFAGEAELIFVDSVSADRSRALVEQFAAGQRRHAEVVRASKPGAAAARNLGASHARGEWLSFVDSDDRVAVGKLAAHFECAGREAPSVAVVYSPFAELNETGSEWEVGRLRTPRLSATDPALSLLEAENFLQIGSTLIRRSAWMSVSGMDESMPIVHDVNLYIRLAIAGFAFTPCMKVSPSLYFRQNVAGSLTTSSQANFYRDAETNADLVRDHYASLRRLGEESVQASLRDVYYFLAYGYARTDVESFRRVCSTLDTFSGFALPAAAGSWLRITARVAGYKRALMWSAKWTRLKSRARS